MTEYSHFLICHTISDILGRVNRIGKSKKRKCANYNNFLINFIHVGHKKSHISVFYCFRYGETLQRYHCLNEKLKYLKLGVSIEIKWPDL